MSNGAYEGANRVRAVTAIMAHGAEINVPEWHYGGRISPALRMSLGITDHDDGTTTLTIYGSKGGEMGQIRVVLPQFGPKPGGNGAQAEA